MGVEIRLDTIIGKLFTIPQLLTEKGYDAVFVGTGAGSPKFAGIPGEAFNGVFSANEFLTRVNLMRGHRQPIYDTPVGMGKRVAVVGAGNTAMDSCRVAKRMGAEKVTVVYRRSRRESPARIEELEHAIEEGIEFLWLTNPVEIVGDSAGWVTGMRVQKMELGEPDASGRRRPVPVAGSEYLLDVDTVIYALGTTANPIIAQTTPGLKINKWGYIQTDEHTGMTSIPGVFAGGDIVTGAATVILAMGAGRKAARGMLEYMGVLAPDRRERPPKGACNMPSSCPKCHRVLDEDEICCAQVRYSWRCRKCFKLTSGFAVPYGKCFLCGGELEVIPGRELGDSMRFRAIRDAVQFELDSFHFYKLARERPARPSSARCWNGSTKPSWTICTSWRRSTTRISTAKWWSYPPTSSTCWPTGSSAASSWTRSRGLPACTRPRSKWSAARATISRSSRASCREGLERDLCQELAAEEEEHVAMLEGELEQLG